MRVQLGVGAAAAAALAIGALPAALRAQPAGPPIPQPHVDFNAAIKPILQTRCVACHGPNQQQAGLRLDDREAAMRGSRSGPVIVPGSSAKSRLFEVVASGKMPLDDELSVLERNNLRTWIDQGAEWTERRTIPGMVVDPRIETWRLAIRNQDRAAQDRLLRDPELVKARGKDGSTALHHAALYGDLAAVRSLLDKGADPNAFNLDGVTPLHWAVNFDPVARLLVERGADVNAASEAGVTALIATAGRANGTSLVRYLVDKGAKPTPQQVEPLAMAMANSANVETFRALMPRVLDPAGLGGEIAATFAINMSCEACLDYTLAQGVKGRQLANALVFAANHGDAAMVKRLLGLGATLEGRGTQGNTALIAAANSDRQAAEKVKLLLDAGADPNLPAPDGRTALVYARTRHPEIAPMLIAKGAK
jgi:ankyrin repeat protein